MEEEADSSGQEERSADDSSLSGSNVEKDNRPHLGIDPVIGDSDLPIMQWEDLSLRIAELEKQEEERRKRTESVGLTEQESETVEQWPQTNHQSLHRRQWDDEECFEGCRYPFITSRFNSPKNLQLCFVNNSESEEEDDEAASSKESLHVKEGRGRCSSGLKEEVRAALSTLRDKLWAEQRQQQQLVCNDVNIRRKILSHSDLQTLSMLQLNALSASLHEDIQDLSSELVKHLVVRDNLRTKQDAMLLDVQDLTST